MSASWLADQLVRVGASRAHAPRVPRFNPRPAGVIRPGSATDTVLTLLVARRVWMNFSQIRAQSGCTSGAMAWALNYLLAKKHVEAVGDDARNHRYQRYRATEEGIRYATSRP